MSGGLSVGDLVDGKYRIIRLVGEGGWGIVFEAENVRTLKRVALKILRNQASVTADIRARFEREAQAAGRIGSEHIVEVFDLGTLEDGSLYMVMELLAGEDLGTRLRATGKLEPVATCTMLVQLLDGLAAAHSAGVMHRDLKPENLFLVPTRSGDEFVKILDFGISKFNSAQAPSSNTMTGAVLGSPCYMAPEQARGLKQIDARTDLYAVGTVFFECLTGRVPFEGDNFNDLMFRIVLAPRPDPRTLSPDIDEALAGIVLKAMAVEPGDRFQSSEEFRQALVTWLDSKGVASVRAPEVRRTTRTPVRTPPEARTTANSGAARGKGKPHWSDATIPVDSGNVVSDGTPIASTRSLHLPTNGGRRRTVAVVLAALFVAVAIGGIALRRERAHEAASAGPTTTEAPTAPDVPPPPAAPSVATPGPEAKPAEMQANAVPSPAPVDDHAAAPTSVSPASSAHHSHVHASHDAGAAESAKPPEPAAASAAPAPPPPPALTQKPTDNKVEGREIRTNL